MRTNRRGVLGIGGAAVGLAVFGLAGRAEADQRAAGGGQHAAGADRSTAGSDRGTVEPAGAESTPTTPAQAAERVAAAFARQSARAGGNWQAYVSVADPAGPPLTAVAASPDQVLQAYSVNKIAVATAVLDKVDRGLLSLSQRVEVTAEIVVPGGDGIFSLDGAYPSSVTLGHALAALLTVSDDTAVRLCGLVCPAAEINQILAGKGFGQTQVQPVANPHRFFLGTSTPRETHDLLRALVAGTLLGPASTGFLIDLLRSPIAYHDGIRRDMSSQQRQRIATKAGWYGDARHEAGVIFDATGAPVLTYAIFADGQADSDDFGATHPATQARAVLGRRFLAAVDRLTGTGTARPPAARRPTNGG